jgi:hypothetical protein
MSTDLQILNVTKIVTKIILTYALRKNLNRQKTTMTVRLSQQGIKKEKN